MENWYYAKNDKQQGPVEAAELKRLISAGEILPSDLIWKDGMADWEPAGKHFPGLFHSESPTASSVGESQATPGGSIPWEDKQNSFFTRLYKTALEVLSAPTAFFSKLNRDVETSFVPSFLFFLIAGTITGVTAQILLLPFNFLGGLAGSTEASDLAINSLGTGAGLVMMIVLIPVILCISYFINAGLQHLVLILLGEGEKKFSTTMVVYGYAAGATSVFQIVPIIGPLVYFAWLLIANSIGLTKAHDIPLFKGILAVVIPIVVCCGLVVVLIGAIAGFAFSAASAG